MGDEGYGKKLGRVAKESVFSNRNMRRSNPLSRYLCSCMGFGGKRAGVYLYI